MVLKDQSFGGKTDHYLAAANNILIYSHLAGALRALQQEGIPVIVLKGAALAKTVYPCISQRCMGDADLLVRFADLERACMVLKELGYRQISEPLQRFNPFKSADTGEILFASGNGVILDLHWELISIEWLNRLANIDLDIFWQDAQPIDVEGVLALQLSCCDLLIHLCLHLAVHNYAFPNGYRDILQVLKHYDPFPWQDFLERARDFRLCTACYFALEPAVIELGARVPVYVLDALRPPALQRWLVTRIADPRKGIAGSLNYTHPRSYLLHLAVADRPLDVLRVLLWLFFPGPHWLSERYHLPGRLEPWLACLWHPFFVLWQGLLGLRELAKA